MIISNRRTPASGRRPITASNSITSGVKNRTAAKRSVTASSAFAGLTPAQKSFTRQLQMNMRRNNSAITAATNTTNIMARPDFIELLPMFVQKLLILDVFGSVAMKSRQQLIPYFKFIAENTKGETNSGDVLSSPFVNRQGSDPNYTGRVVRNELLSDTDFKYLACSYVPILPGSATITISADGVKTPLVDDGTGQLKNGTNVAGTIDYSTGNISLASGVAPEVKDGNAIYATYQYDNENIGPHGADMRGHEYGAQMGKGSLQLDEFNLVAEAHQLACYWSVYSAFAAQTEYGANIGDIAKEAAFSEITAEINSNGFRCLEEAASYNPQFNWDASPVKSGSVVPHDYLNMFKLKLGQASAHIYQTTRLSRPNRLVVGSNVAEYIKMIDSFQVAAISDSVGPYELGTLDQFKIYVDPSLDADKWVMSCKSDDIRRNSALFGEYMPLTSTDPIGLANASVQQGYATMYGMKVVNPSTVVSGKIVGTF